jgi:hypothetical protein
LLFRVSYIYVSTTFFQNIMAIPDKKRIKNNYSNEQNLELFESLVGVAQENFSHTDSNYLHIGCFTSLELRKMVKSLVLPNNEVLSHLVNCATCFRDYRFALQISKHIIINNQPRVKISWKNWFSFSINVFLLVWFLFFIL